MLTAENQTALRKSVSLRLRDWLSDDRRFWQALACLGGLIAFLKAVRTPNSWSATQAQFDYSEGFVKRGLFGEILSLFNVHHYVPFAWVSFITLLILIGMLVWYGARHDKEHPLVQDIVLCLYFCSFGFSYLVNLIGYLDIILAVLAVACLIVRQTYARMILALLIVPAGILMHEMFLIVYLPVLLLSFLLPAQPASGQAGLRLCFPAVLLAVAVIATAFVSFYPALNPTRLTALEQVIAARVDFPLNPQVLRVLGRPTRDNLQIMLQFFGHFGWWYEQFESALVFCPLAGLFILLSLQYLGELKNRPGVKVLIVAVSLSPLLMNFLGWDLFRWWALTVLTSFLTLVTVRRSSLSAGYLPAPPWLRNLAFLLIACNLASGVGLLDGRQPNIFPFHDLILNQVEARTHLLLHKNPY